MTRQEAIDTIKRAYENNQLGFQKGASDCRYYDKASDSCCAIGVLLDIDKMTKDSEGDVSSYNLERTIDDILYSINAKSLHGLTVAECVKLQRLHDKIVQGMGYEKEFKEYLYNLE